MQNISRGFLDILEKKLNKTLGYRSAKIQEREAGN